MVFERHNNIIFPYPHTEFELKIANTRKDEYATIMVACKRPKWNNLFMPSGFPSITFYLRKDDSRVCFLRIDNGRITLKFDDSTNIDNSVKDEIQTYFDKNVSSWESKKTSVQTGGMKPNGTVWDGVQTVGISDNPGVLLFDIYLNEIANKAKKQIFGMKYVIVFDFESKHTIN
jgi:hypothetical protein